MVTRNHLLWHMVLYSISDRREKTYHNWKDISYTEHSLGGVRLKFSPLFRYYRVHTARISLPLERFF